MYRHRGAASIRMAHDVVAAPDPRQLESVPLQRADDLVAGNGRDWGHQAATGTAREVGTLRALADVRQTTASKQRATLLSVAAVGWGKPETGTTPTDAAVTPSAVAPDPIPVHDLVSLALIGEDELGDAPASAQASIVDAVGMAIADAEDSAFAAGTGSGQPAGLALAANVALVPAGQKLAVAVSNTPTWAQLQTVPWLLPTRYRNRAVWLMHPTSAQKVAALTAGTGEGLVWPDPGRAGSVGLAGARG